MASSSGLRKGMTRDELFFRALLDAEHVPGEHSAVTDTQEQEEVAIGESSTMTDQQEQTEIAIGESSTVTDQQEQKEASAGQDNDVAHEEGTMTAKKRMNKKEEKKRMRGDPPSGSPPRDDDSTESDSLGAKLRFISAAENLQWAPGEFQRAKKDIRRVRRRH